MPWMGVVMMQVDVLRRIHLLARIKGENARFQNPSKCCWAQVTISTLFEAQGFVRWAVKSCSCTGRSLSPALLVN